MLAVAVGTAIAVAGGLAAWWFLLSAPLVNRYGGFGIGLREDAPGQSWTVGIAVLCLDGAPGAQIEAVTADAGQLSVSDFAVRPAPRPPAPRLGTAAGPLRAAGFGDGRVVSGRCEREDLFELAVEVVRSGEGTARTRAFDIHWSAGSRSGVLTAPVAVVLCAPGEGDQMCPRS